MGICSECFSMLNVYWKYTRKWFLAMAAGMAALELGLLLYYVNGGYRYMYITEGNTKTWPMEYGGALQSIQLDYIVLVFIVAILFFLILSYLSVFNKKTSMLTQRLPIRPILQLLIQIVHSLIMLLSFWLVQFLIIIAGFLLYRFSAPDGLMIDLQVYKIFWYPGLVARLYPFIHVTYLANWLLFLACLSVLPTFITYRKKATEAYILWRTLKTFFVLFVYFIIRSLSPEYLRSKMDVAFILLFLLAIAGYLLYRGIRLEKEKT